MRISWLGCWVGLNNLMRPLEKINLDGGFSAITSRYGQILTENPSNRVMLDLGEGTEEENGYRMVSLKGNEDYLQVKAGSRCAAVNMVALIPDRNVLGDFYQIQGMLILMSLLILMMLPLAGGMVHRFLYRPLKSLTDTMESVKEGNMEIRQEDHTHLREISVLTRQFNEMMDFFLNCMSLMHGLAQLRRYREIQKLSQSLVKYFRYMFKKAGTLIHIKTSLSVSKVAMSCGYSHMVHFSQMFKKENGMTPNEYRARFQWNK